MKQSVVTIKAELENGDNRTTQFRQDRLFETNQEKLFQELNEQLHETTIADTEEFWTFWKGI